MQSGERFSEQTHSVAPLLPVRLLGRLHQQSQSLPASIEFLAAVLFADVSRYCNWVELLVHRGSKGLERVPKVLDDTYGSWVEHIHALDGEVIQFAGDSLVAFWPADNGGGQAAVAAAEECAQRLCLQSRSFDASQPGVHVGVGVGSLWAAAIGGLDNHWNLVVGGEALRDAAAAQSRAARWRLELSPSARRQFDAPYRPSTTPPSSGSRTVPQPAWLERFVPRPWAAWLAADRSGPAGSHEWSEIREITALFAAIRGLSESEPNALERHQQLFSRLQQIVAGVEGPSGQLAVDDKGLVFTSVFGAPGTFHRDDSVRAVLAAREIHAAVRELGLACSVGVAAGDACFRAVGAASRYQLITVGTPMNRAARLMALGSDGVACDAATEKASRSRLRFEPGVSLQAEGLSAPIQSYRPLGECALSRQRQPLLGRARELSSLHEAFASLQECRARLVVVSGEAGIGKSRLVEEFVEQLSTSVPHIAVARAEPGDERSSLLSWRRVLLRVLELSEDATAAEVLEVLGRRLAGQPELSRQLPLLSAVIPSDAEDSGITRHLQPTSRADATVRFLAELLAVLMPAPRVIVLEDAHWLDSASWRVLEWALARARPLFVLLCLRREENLDEYRRLLARFDSKALSEPSKPGLRELDLSVMTLEELPEASLASLVAHTLGSMPASSELVKRIVELSRGNPFFAEEMTLALRSDGLIAIRDGAWRTVSEVQFGQFDALERVIIERLDKLERRDQWTLRVASVVGRSFSRAALGHVLWECQGLDAVELQSALESLETHYLVRPLQGRPDHFEFRHDQIRDVVYVSTPPETRRELHRAVGLYLEGQQRRPDYPALVQHLGASGEVEKAVTYADLAAQDAMKGGAFREAEHFLAVCLRHEAADVHQGSLIRCLRWRRQTAEACEGRGDVRGQHLAIDDALSLVGRPGPVSRAGAALGMLLGLLRAILYMVFLDGRRRGNDEQRQFQAELARCYMQASAVHYFSHRPEHCVWATTAALNSALQSGPSPELVSAQVHAGAALGLVGFSRLGDWFLMRSRRLAGELGAPSVRARALVLESLYRLGLGQWQSVQSALDESQELCELAGDSLNWCNAQVLRYWLHHYLGDWAQAELTAEALLSRAQNSGNLQQELWALRCKALCALVTERPKQAQNHLKLSLAALSESSDLSEHIACNGCMALALARMGEHKDSIVFVRKTLELQQQIPRPTVHSSLESTAALVEVLLRGREDGLARGYPRWAEWEESALRQLYRHSRAFPTGVPRYGLWRGVSLRLSGEHARAHESWRRALSRAERMGLKHDVALIRAEMRRFSDLASER